MRWRNWMVGVSLLVGSTVVVAQPPKSAVPRSLPETQATTIPEKSATSAEEKNKGVPALIKVKVPDNATIWFENQRMSQSGAVRVFQSPVLEAKKTYFYKIKVSWPMGSGTLAKDFVSEQEVSVKAGETTTVDFTMLASHTKEVKPTSTRDLIRQAAHTTPAPDRNKPNNK